MDPNRTLSELRGLVTQALTLGDEAQVSIEDIASVFHNLDNWLIKGGFIPDAWLDAVKGTADKMIVEQMQAARLKRCAAGESCSGAAFPGHPAHEIVG